MAEKEQRKSEEEEREMKIPVFTVMKNGAIIKNIFLVHKQPSPLFVSESVKNEENPDQENGKEILIVGRHPDCHIMLTHPSISRFHVQIQSKPSSEELSVIDLSSVHGTWVSENRIEPGVPVELNEGDTIKIGGSTRVYRLHWVPLSLAYDMDNPFVSPLDLSMAELKEVENQVLEANKVEIHQGDNSVSIENGETELQDSLAVEGKEEKTCQDQISARIQDKAIQSLDLILEGIASLFSDENSELIPKKEIPSSGIESVHSSSLPVGGNISVSDEQQLDKDDRTPWLDSVIDVISERENPDGILRRVEKSSKALVNFALPCNVKGGKILQEMENQSHLQKGNELRDESEVWSESLMKEYENLSLVLGEITSEITTEQLKEEKHTVQSLAVWQPLSEIGNKENSSVDQNLNSLVNQNYECFGEENCCPAAEVYEEAENQNLLREGHMQKETQSFNSKLLEAESVNSSLPFGEVLLEITDSKKCQTPQSLYAPEGLSVLENSENSPLLPGKRSSMHSIWSRRGKPASVLQIQTSRSRGKTKGDCKDAVVELSQKDKMDNESISKILFSDLEEMEEEIFTNKENFTPVTLLMKSSKRKGKPQEIKHSRSGLSKFTCSPSIQLDKENQTPTSDNESISKVLFSDLEEMEEETFTPNKENFTPDTLLMKSSKRKGKLQEIKHSRSGLSKFTCSPSMHLDKENQTPTSDKENQTPKVLREQKLAREISRTQVRLEQERVPFESLLVNSMGKRRSETSLSNATTRSSNSVNFTRTTEVSNSSFVGEGRRCWTMVVDTTTLLDKESRKSLQLLQGLKGTQLIVPRMVIRELDYMKRRGLFRRASEVSSLLDWIEECMVKSNWWIHIQSSVEEGRPIAPTPPASPQFQFSEGSEGFPCGTKSWTSFLSRTSLTEIVSPTAEDHILDCALIFRKMKTDGQLVLLSSNVTMKIKAMAEGLICETAQEFRESLVNPFSERFLWADSSPRGRTWSYLDDVVLRDNYSRVGPLKKKPSKGGDGAKGLKLILLHNSHYANISSVR